MAVGKREGLPDAIPTTTDSREHRPFRGIALSVFGIGCITFNDSMMKLVVDDHPIGQAIFIRGIFVLLLISLLVYRQGGLRVLRIHNMRLQIWSAILLVLPIFLFIYALSQLPLSIATIIFFTNPLFVCLFAPIWLGERITWLLASSVALGLVGATLVLNPTSSVFEWVLLAPLAVALLSAIRELVLRQALARETAVSTLFYASLAVTVLAACTFPLGWVAMDWREYGLLALSAFGFGLGIYSMTESLCFAPASAVAPYKYSAIIWALLLSYLLWGEAPTPMVWIGTALIIASGVAVLWAQRDASH
jgi:drug/metabolite transporter (DMT)-like permease